MLIDTHSHIHFKKYFPSPDEVIANAEKAGVKGQILVGCDVRDSFTALEIVKSRPDKKLWCTLGVHPHDSNQLTAGILKKFEQTILEENQNGRKIVAIGEIGLDYNRNFQSEDIQKNAFFEQLGLAKKLDLTAVIHERDAWDETMEILARAGNTKVVLHSFSGGLNEAQQCIERGYYISFSGMLTYSKNDHLRDVARIVPLDKALVETDCPYLPPQQYRGSRNEPAYVVETAKELAKHFDTDYEGICELTTKNAGECFGIDL